MERSKSQERPEPGDRDAAVAAVCRVLPIPSPNPALAMWTAKRQPKQGRTALRAYGRATFLPVVEATCRWNAQNHKNAQNLETGMRRLRRFAVFCQFQAQIPL